MVYAVSVRELILKWLGVEDIGDFVERSFAAAELRAYARHVELINALSAINKRLVNEHVGAPRSYTPDVLDWDTVQAIALADLERNPLKEN